MTPEFLALAAHPLRWAILAELARSDRRVRELVALVDEPQNLVSYHLRLLRAGGLVSSRRSSFDARDTYYRLDLDRCAAGLAETAGALHPSLVHAAPSRRPGGGPDRPSVLFLCTGNSARSPLAEHALRRLGRRGVRVASAGTHPRGAMHPLAVRAGVEVLDVDLSRARPRHWSALGDQRFDVVVSLCDRAREEEVPVDAGRRQHWSLPDPSEPGEPDDYDRFASTAADIGGRVRHLLPTLSAIHD